MADVIINTNYLKKPKIILAASSLKGGEQTHLKQIQAGLSHKFEFNLFTDYNYSFKSFFAQRQNPILQNVALIHCHGLRAATFFRLLRFFKRSLPPIIVTIHGFHYARYQNPFKKYLFLALESILSRQQLCTIAVSQSDYDDLQKYHCASANLMKIPNGIALPQNQTTDFSQNMVNLATDKIIITAGALEWVKGHDLLIAAAEQLKQTQPNLKVLIFGQGVLHAQLNQQIQQANLADTVFLMGSTDQLAAWLSLAHCFVLPSRYEGLPYALLEAMQAKVPIITTDTVGCRDLIKHQDNGLLFAKDNSTDLAQQIAYLLANSQQAEIFKQRSYDLVINEYSQEKMLKELTKLYGKYCRPLTLYAGG